MTKNQSDGIFYGGLHAVVTPISSSELIELDEPRCLEELGQFSEPLLLNDSVVVPIRGPSLELVALVRWFGRARIEELIDGGVLRFIFCPGTLAFVSERNKRALRLKAGPGLEHFIGEAPDWRGVWESTENAVAFAFHKQLGYDKATAQNLGALVDKHSATTSPTGASKSTTNALTLSSGTRNPSSLS